GSPRAPLALPVPIAVAVSAAAALALGRVADVGQPRELARALDRGRDLVLVAAAGARDAAGPGLFAPRDEAPQRADVLVVDVLDLVLAEQAGLAPAAAGAALLVPPACGLAIALLGHLESRRIHRQHRTRAYGRRATTHCGSLRAVGSAKAGN